MSTQTVLPAPLPDPYVPANFTPPPKEALLAAMRALAAHFNLVVEEIPLTAENPIGSPVSLTFAMISQFLPPIPYVRGMVCIRPVDVPNDTIRMRVVMATDFFEMGTNNPVARIRKYAMDMGAWTPPPEAA